MNRRTFLATAAAGFGGTLLMKKNVVATNSLSIAAGYQVASITADADDLVIEGAGAPLFDGANLVGGTVIQGQINANNKRRVIIRNLGVDVRGLGLDAIRSGTQGTGQRQELIIENVTLLGDGVGHGIALVSGSHNLVKNVTAYNFQHGVIFRCSHSRLDGAYLENITVWSVGIKAAAVSGNADHCSITGVTSSGLGQIAVKAEDGYSTRFSHIHDCHMTGSQARAVTLLADPGGNADYATISQVTSVDSASTSGDFVINGIGAATFVGCQAINPAAYGFYKINSSDVQLIGCRGNTYGF